MNRRRRARPSPRRELRFRGFDPLPGGLAATEVHGIAGRARRRVELIESGYVTLSVTHATSLLSEAFGESFINTVRGIAPAIVGRPEGKEGWRP